MEGCWMLIMLHKKNETQLQLSVISKPLSTSFCLRTHTHLHTRRGVSAQCSPPSLASRLLLPRFPFRILTLKIGPLGTQRGRERYTNTYIHKKIGWQLSQLIKGGDRREGATEERGAETQLHAQIERGNLGYLSILVVWAARIICIKLAHNNGSVSATEVIVWVWKKKFRISQM